MNALSLLKLMPDNSKNSDVFAKQIIDVVKSGDECPLKIIIKVKAILSCMNDIFEGIVNLALDEADKYPTKNFEIENTKIEKGQKSTYNYKDCADEIWNDFSKKKKEREVFLKSLKEPLTIVDDLSGEVREIYPPSKKTTSFLKFKF